MTSPEVLAYEQAQDRLERQVDRLAEMRTTTNFLLAGTALVASFLGDRALDLSGVDTIDVLALAALVLGVLCGIRPLWPVRDKEPHGVTCALAGLFGEGFQRWLGLKTMWKGYVKVDDVLSMGQGAKDDAVYLALARELEARATDDALLLDRRLLWLMACASLLAVQVILWSFALITQS